MDERDEAFPFSFNHQHVVRAGGHQSLNLAEWPSVFELDVHPDQVGPVVFAGLRLAELAAPDRYLGTRESRRLIPIRHALEPGDHSLAVGVAFRHLPLAPAVFLLQLPSRVLNDLVPRFGPGQELAPALDAERSADLADND